MPERTRTQTAPSRLWLETAPALNPPANNGAGAQAALEAAARSLLINLGEDPEREGLQNTPKRVGKMLRELTAGYQQDLDKLVNGAVFSSDYDEIVLVKDIEFHSLCEHHMLPFNGVAHCAYIPDGQVIGLSKIPRIVDMFARRLQIQEELTRQIAATIEAVIAPRGVAVMLEGVHMCSVMRGVQKSQARMATQVMLGEFKTDPRRREEFQRLVSG